jgi:xylulose-5-phosphate/fructose-6-phosphate phosphoketolase
LTYKRPGQEHLHVRGYKEKGNIDTPLELAIRNSTDRFSLAMDAIDRMPNLGNRGSSARQSLLNEQIAAKNQAYEDGTDPAFLKDWTWPKEVFGKEGGGWKQAIAQLTDKGKYLT